MITIIKLQSLFGDLASKGMKQVFEDWQMLVGFDAKTTCEPIRIASSIDEPADSLGGGHVLVETQVLRNDESIGPIHFAFPDALVIEVIADVLMIPAEAKEEKAKSGLSEYDLEAFTEMANLLCGSWNRTFQSLECNLKISQSVDDLRVLPTTGEVGALVEHDAGGRMAWLSYRVDTANATFPLVQVIPFDVSIAIAEVLSAAREKGTLAS